jgi:hypothetical protein
MIIAGAGSMRGLIEKVGSVEVLWRSRSMPVKFGSILWDRRDEVE